MVYAPKRAKMYYEIPLCLYIKVTFCLYISVATFEVIFVIMFVNLSWLLLPAVTR